MNDQQLGALIRAVRRRRGLRQADLARLAGVSRATVSLLERGHWERLAIARVRGIAAAIDVRVEVVGRWRGGDASRLLSRRHSLLAETFATFMAGQLDWVAEPEVSFAVYGERGVVDLLAWHEPTAHLLVVELKTEFVDFNEMLGTLDRKLRLARTIGASRGWHARLISAWLIVADTKTNRRHAKQHATLLHSRLALDGRQLRAFLRDPSRSTTGLAFWTDTNGGSASPRVGRRPGDRGGQKPPRSSRTAESRHV